MIYGHSSMDTASNFGAWTRYFEHISHFLEGAERQYGIANHSFCEYVLGRLELCINTCTQLHDQLSTSVEYESDERETIDRYRDNIVGLVESLKEIHSKWVDYEDMLDIRATRFRYETERITSVAGRPCFRIEKEQLEYLSSLHFSWTEIASLLGVSRMTIYRLMHGVNAWSLHSFVFSQNNVTSPLIMQF